MALGATQRLRLRQKIDDLSESIPAFSIYVTDVDCSYANLTISGSTLSTTISGGTLSALTLSLTASTYDTITELVDYINTKYGYKAILRPTVYGDHNSSDLYNVYSTDIKNGIYEAKVKHFFDDTTLDSELNDALYDHVGTSYTWSTVGSSEERMVILKAASSLMRMKAAHYAEYYPVDTEGSSIDKGAAVEHCLDLANAFEEQYNNGLANSVGGPCVRTAFKYRKSPFTGTYVPYAREQWPTAVTISSGSTTTTSTTIYWTICNDEAFYSYEVYYSLTSGVTSSSTLSSTITDRAQLYHTITGLTTGTDYYIMVATKGLSYISTNSMIAFSNELTITTS